MKSRIRPIYILIGVLFLVINVAAVLISRYIYRQSVNQIISYGDTIPVLLGPDIKTSAETRVIADRATLVLYLSSAHMPSRNVELAKYGEILMELYGDKGLKVSAIVQGKITDLKGLIDRSLIRYQVIEDPDRRLAQKLGLNPKENGVFFFDSRGICRFSTNAIMHAEDLRQLVAAEFLKIDPFDKSIANARPIEKGQSLGSWLLTDTQSWTQTTLEKVRSSRAGLMIFFTAECSICSLPEYLKKFAQFDRTKRRDNTAGEVIALIFDYNFAHSDVVDQMRYFNIQTPAYIANEELVAVSNLARLQLSGKGDSVAIAFNDKGLVLDVSSLERLRALALEAEFAAADSLTTPREDHAVFSPVFGSVALDPFDITTHDGKYYVSDTAGNRVLVFDENLELERSIGMIGSAPDRLLHPGDLAVARDATLFVQDGGNSRIQHFSLDGQFLGGFRTTRYEGFALGANNEIYLGQPENGYLISAYSSSGKHLRSFGKLKEHSDLFGPESAEKNESYRVASNRIAMTTDEEGNIFVAFQTAPLVQLYKSDGTLVLERWLQGERVEHLTEVLQRQKYFTTSNDGVESHILTFDVAFDPKSKNFLLLMVDGSVHTIDRAGKIISSLTADTEENLRPFTPHRAGLGAQGEVIIVPFEYKRCFKMVPPTNRVTAAGNGAKAALSETTGR